MADCDGDADCCPLCMEELDLTDQTFNACPCGYQVCLWCWHQIKNEYNGLCPACRQPYAELSKQKNPLDRDEVVRRTKQRKQKEKSERRSAAQAKHAPVNRKSLQNVRVMQRNLVYVIGLPVHFAEEDVLRSNECFGQYGKIVKAVVNKSHLSADRANATASAYITFANKEDALCCIVAIDGYYLDSCLLRASFGTTKYCNFFLRNMQCNNPDCLYLHELGDEDDSFTKEEMQSALHSGKAAFRDMSLANGQIQEREGSRFPPAHRPPVPPRTASTGNVRAPSPARGTTLVRSHSEEPYGDTQRHAQSAAAISKLRQTTGDSSNSSRSSSPDHTDRAPAAQHTEYPPLTRGHSYSNIVAGGHSSSYAGVAAAAPAPAIPVPASVPDPVTAPVPDPAAVDPVPYKKPDLRVDTSREEDTKQAVETVVGPLEALKLATGSSTEQPAWAQPFPTPAVSPSESEAQTTAAAAGSSTATGVYSPFGLGFEGGIRRASSARELTPKAPVSGDLWGSSNASDVRLDSFSPAAPTMSASASSSSSFASIDAIFSQRNDSSEALAGLLGVQLAPNPLAHGAPLAAPTQDAHTSRFSFANPADAGRDGMQQTTARYELLDGTTVNSRSSFGGFDAPRAGNAPPASSGFPSTTDRSGFPPLGSSQLHHAPPPPHPSRSSFGGDFRSNELPLGGSSALGGESGGLAFLQQMLPNVNISFGGDYPSLSGAGSSGVGVATTPARSTSTGRGRSPGRRLFERSQSAGVGLVSPDAWDGGSLSSLGFDGQSSGRRASSGSAFYDPTLVPQPSSGFSSNLYGFNSSSSMATNDSENDRLRMHNAFGGDAYRRSGSLINNS
ncbi:CCR4-NOT transcription complex subunit 4 [Phytophthora pseudosyringae]|uniref:CCR4-NOT transcription complex subunit 4 n=1 Tax=Phytophthora pseudosyringae TaxID=221518 RepID=A0A8T1WA66_9STRA|nr:CCR4-NOT transcription complex subunit 4 [Phytophthora pseudosyringae]